MARNGLDALPLLLERNTLNGLRPGTRKEACVRIHPREIRRLDPPVAKRQTGTPGRQRKLAADEVGAGAGIVYGSF